MSNDLAGPNADLQFDTVATGDAVAGAVTCQGCQRTIHAEYYDVSGQPTCADCCRTVQALTDTPRGAGPLLKAAVFGGAAGIAGAAVYYAVIALTNFEIGIVAILIGYMVGYAVRKGAGGRGGRRFQVLAVALTYASIALAYTPLAFGGDEKRDGTAQSASNTQTANAARPAAPTAGQTPQASVQAS